MKWLALLLILLIVPSTFAASVTVDIYGTNVSNAQSNLTQTGNNSYQIIQWAVGDTTKSLKADINGNVSDDITFTLHNFTANRVIEVKVNSSAFNAYQANSTGTISFTRTQTVRNQTYSFTPAENKGGLNFTWAQFWSFPSLFGSNFTQYFLPYSGATADLNMNGKNITNVKTLNVTTTNVTVLNATNINGNGSGIFSLNASNITIGTLPRARHDPYTAYNNSVNTWTQVQTLNGTNLAGTAFGTQGFVNLHRGGGFESWSGGVNVAPDGDVGINMGAGSTINRESTNIQSGLYAVNITTASGQSGGLQRYYSTSYKEFPGWIASMYQGKTFTASIRMKTTSSTGYISLGDSITGATNVYHSGGGGWETLTVTKTINAASTEITSNQCFTETGGVTLFCDNFILVEGSVAPVWSENGRDWMFNDPYVNGNQSQTIYTSLVFGVNSIYDIGGLGKNANRVWATEFVGGGSRLSDLNASNITTGILPNASIPLSALNRSDTNIFSGNTSNLSVVKNANGTYNIDTVGGSAFNSHSNVLRARNTVYQNTNGTPMMISIVYRSASILTGTFYSDASNPPTTVKGRIYTQSDATSGYLTAMVKSNDYYSFNVTADTVTDWNEFW